MKSCLVPIISTALLALSSSAFAAGGPGSMKMPDFTKGDTIPAGAKHDWNLGPTGLRGWIFSDRMVTTDARQISITKVDKGSPADGQLAVGDVLLGVGGKPFSYDPRTEMGRAITAAETEAGGGNLALTRWRNGKSEELVVKLSVLGDYGDTTPYNCAKSKRILERGIKALAARMSEQGYGGDAIPRSLNALALLACGDAQYNDLVKREAKWAADFETDGYRTWYYGYVMIFLAEYISATGDTSMLPGLRRLALEAAKGQSAVGSWGHTFARPDGRLKGYGMMNSPGVPLTIGLVLARGAGVKDPEIAHAIEMSAKLLRFFISKGSVPYGDHNVWTETHEDNGKNGMAALLFNLLDEPKGADFFSRMGLAAHHNERDAGHTGNFFNMTWSLTAIALGGPQATGAWMREYGAWYFDLARHWDGTFVHQGPPEKDNDSYEGYDATGAYLLAYALPLKKTALTGKKPAVISPLSAADAQGIVADGRGWTDKDRTSYYDKFSEAELRDRLGSWSPIVRERAAMALARRKGVSIPDIITLLDSPDVNARIGACQTLENLGGAAASAVPQLRKTLHHTNLWLRVKAAESLAAIGKPALPALPDLLELIEQGATKEDPRAMEQRFVSTAVFDKLLVDTTSLEAVDRGKLRAAITLGLKNQDGRARGSISNIYQRLSFEDIKPLLPAILDAVVTPAPSGEMFADEVRVNGLKVLAAHHVEEGLAACADYVTGQNPWASEERIKDILPILLQYGVHAKAVIPKLRKAIEYFEQREPDFPKQLSMRKAKAVRDTIAKITASTERPELIRIH